VALSLLDCKTYLDTLGIPYGSVATLIGGGSKGTLWSQIAADVLGMTFTITESSDSSLGSAMLAGIATGIFADAADAVKKCIKPRRVVTPNEENTKAYAALFPPYKRIHDALAPIYGEG
jgi:sugar (pentulose or hexulose) kinase